MWVITRQGYIQVFCIMSRAENVCTDEAKMGFVCLGRHHVGVGAGLAGAKTVLAHTLCAFAGLWSAFWAFGFAVAVLLVEFLLAALTLLLEAFDDVDGASHVAIIILIVVTIRSNQAGSIVCTTEGIWCSWKRLGVGETRSGAERCESNRRGG